MNMQAFVESLTPDEREALRAALRLNAQATFDDITAREMADWTCGRRSAATSSYTARTGKGLIYAMQHFAHWDAFCQKEG